MRQLNLPSTNDLFENATTARQVAEISNHLENIQAYEKVVIAEQARRNAIMEEGAKASIEQKELLLQQLEAVKEQNKLLEKQIREMQDKNTLLNELYDNSQKESIANAKDAKHNKIFGWVSFAVGTLIGIAGIILGIIF